MPFELQHTFVSRFIKPKLRKSGEQAFLEVADQGQFAVLFPGRVTRGARATYFHRFRADGAPVETQSGEPQGGSQPLKAGFETAELPIELDLRIFTPDGIEFTRPEITIADLARFRDPLGAVSGLWSFRLTGRSQTHFVDADSKIVNPQGTMRIGVIETISSESAPPLVDNAALSRSLLTFDFDLFRVGTFIAQISSSMPWRGRMRLIDPDGAVRAQSTRPELRFDVGLPTLDKSRDAAGNVRKWRLEVTTTGSLPFGTKPRVKATVIGSGRITIAAIQKRIDALIGERGRFLRIFGDNRNGKMRARMSISDVAAIETLDIHHLLENWVSRQSQDPGVDPRDLKAGVVYTVGQADEEIRREITALETTLVLRIDVSGLKVDAIDVAIGPGVMLGASIPAVRLTVSVSGEAKIKFKGATVAEARVRNGKLEIEFGLKAGADGTPEIVTAIRDDPLDVDPDEVVIAGLALVPPVLFLLNDMIEGQEGQRNRELVDGIKSIFADPNIAPNFLMTVFGAHLTYRPFRIEGGDIVFDHIAPVEPDPKPRPGYQACIGRDFTQLGPNAVRFNPAVLGDTWKAENLARIDHVVVVMMENRSYDHVLGYRAEPDGSNGLTDALVATIQKAPHGPFVVRDLSLAGFRANAAGLRTKLPRGVGHDFEDVQQQLGVRIPHKVVADNKPTTVTINSPKGLVDNFKPRLKLLPGEEAHDVVPDDVLGFYDEESLGFFDFLAAHYAYSDRYYCSHPGPTLPNRMYSLAGDLQYDRYGFPILNNNNGENFLLSRAPTICDLLLRKGKDFRFYESEPSVTMLRMFARYATDTTRIVPIERLEADIAAGDLPEFTMIDPQMHAHPQNDDHPPVDMLRGQHFLWKVYTALRSNAALWEKTLLIITYDEHGGFYDHVVPRVAEFVGGNRQAIHPGSVGQAGGFTQFTSTLGAATATTAAKAPLTSTIGVNRPTTATRPPPVASPPPAQPALLAIPYGVRVPTFVVSPWVKPGKGPSVTLDHCSILKTVLARFLGDEKPFLSDRVAHSHSFDAFLTETSPRMDVPEPDEPPELLVDDRLAPSPTTRIATKPLSRRQMREGPVDYHELSGWWARQLGR